MLQIWTWNHSVSLFALSVKKKNVFFKLLNYSKADIFSATEDILERNETVWSRSRKYARAIKGKAWGGYLNFCAEVHHCNFPIFLSASVFSLFHKTQLHTHTRSYIHMHTDQTEAGSFSPGLILFAADVIEFPYAERWFSPRAEWINSEGRSEQAHTQQFLKPNATDEGTMSPWEQYEAAVVVI